MFYLTTYSTHFIYGYMASDIWQSTTQIVREETCCHMGYFFRLTARVLLCAPSHRQDNTYHGLCYTSRVSQVFHYISSTNVSIKNVQLLGRAFAHGAHTMAFVTPVVEHWLEREIVQWVHPMKDRSDDPSHHE